MEASAQFWDSIADEYAQKPVADVPAYEAKLQATKARLSADDVVLDLGCGTGSLALELAPHARHVHSVDISSEMIRIGRHKASVAGVENITFHHTPVDTLPAFETGSFNMVCAYNIVHLVEDRAALLARIRELLAPGGHFVSTTPCLGEGAAPIALGIRGLIATLRLFGKAPERVESLSVPELLAEYEAAGFVDITRKPVSKSRRTAFVLARSPW